MVLTPPIPPSAQSVQTKKKPPGDLAQGPCSEASKPHAAKLQ
jgi:hypothetical protein